MTLGLFFFVMIGTSFLVPMIKVPETYTSGLYRPDSPESAPTPTRASKTFDSIEPASITPSSITGQPLSSKITRIVNDDEIVFLAGDLGTHDAEFVINGEASSWANLGSWDTPLGTDQEIVTGDVDGDGVDEIIATGASANTRIWKYVGSTFTLNHTFSDGGVDALATGDLNGDGYDEVITLNGGNLVVYNYSIGAYTTMWTAPGTSTMADPRVTTGDVDGDCMDEVAILTGDATVVRIRFFDGNGTVLKERQTGIYPPCDIACGDLDGDGYDETVYVEFSEVMVFDDSRTDFTRAYFSSGFYGDRVAIANFDDDTREEVAILQRYDIDGMDVYLMILDSASDLFLSETNGATIYHSMDDDGTINGVNLVAGNFDNDVRSEIACTYSINPTPSYMYDDWFGYAVVDDTVESCAIRTSGTYDYNVEDAVPAVAAGDFDKDSITLRYTGEHDVALSNPRVLAVIAAPPFIAGTSQYDFFCQSTFGTEASNQNSETNGYSVQVEAGGSIAKGDLFGVLEVEVQIGFQGEWTYTKTETSSISYATSYATDAFNDYVVFESILYEQYVYEIIGHPNASMIGDPFVLSIPTGASTYKWTVDYFNDHNGEFPDFGSETFNHTTGQAWTYPSLAQQNAIYWAHKPNGAWRSSPIPVGAGYSFNSASINLGSEVTTESERSLGGKISISATWGKVFKFGLYTSIGLSDVHSESTTIGQNTVYEGSVPDLAPKDYDTYKYSFGLFVYNVARDDREYQVFNYWVEDYYGPHENPLTLNVDPADATKMGVVYGVLGVAAIAMAWTRPKTSKQQAKPQKTKVQKMDSGPPKSRSSKKRS